MTVDLLCAAHTCPLGPPAFPGDCMGSGVQGLLEPGAPQVFTYRKNDDMTYSLRIL